MKHKLLLSVIQLVAFGSVCAQNVNGLLFDATNSATRDASAVFEINANTNTPGSPLYGGLLLPRVALTGTTDATTIAGTESTSLLVYNTATTGDVTPGFYYWVAAPTNAWQRIIAGNSNFPTGTGTPNYLARWITSTTLGIGVAYDNGTNVGIGITNPLAKLEINNTAAVPALSVGENGTDNGGAYGMVNLTKPADLTRAHLAFIRSGNYVWQMGYVQNTNTLGIFPWNLTSAGTPSMSFTTSGNVGISESNPGAKLEIEGISANWNETTPGLTEGSIHLDPGSGTDHFGSAITWGASDASNGDNAQAGIYVRSDGSYGTKMYFGTTDAYVTGSKTRMYIGADGNVGVNNTVPSFKLDVQQDITMSGDINPGTSQLSVGGTSTVGKRMLLGYDTNGNGFGFIKAGNYGVSWTPLSLQPNGGNVGVGNTGPVVKLHVTGNAFFDLPVGGVALENSLTIKKNGQGQINFGSYPGAWTPALQIQNNDNTRYVWISPLDNTSGGNSRLVTGGSSFDMYAGNTYSATFTTGGNVGVGITTPQGKLDVTGDIFGVNEYSFQGCSQSIKDWDYSGLNTNPACNTAGDDSWYIDVPGTSNWGRGILSRRRFSRTPGLTLEYEAYLQDNFGYGYVHWMVGFVDGNSASYTYCQNPANLMYHDNANLSVYDNCSGQGSDYSVDTRNAWYKFKIVLKGAGADYYIFHNGAWRLVKSTGNNSNKYVRVHVTGHNSRMYFRNMRIYQGDLNATASGPFTASYSTGSSSSNQAVYFSSGGDVISNTSPSVYMSGAGSILLVANVTATATSVTYNSAPNYGGGANIAGTASYRVELQRSLNGGGWTTLMSGSDNVGLQTADMYRVMGAYYGWIAAGPNSSGVYGDRFSFPGNVSINYIENATAAGTYAYRLVFVPLGFNRNGGYYEIWDRSLNAVPIKQ